MYLQAARMVSGKYNMMCLRSVGNSIFCGQDLIFRVFDAIYNALEDDSSIRNWPIVQFKYNITLDMAYLTVIVFD